ncbi:MAG: long-chain fatty acid--CoA ligase [bacterium]|nr:long-chain fatty acid--CoA ligase [bacterium]
MSATTIPGLFLAAVTANPRPDCFSSKGPDGAYVDVSSAEALLRVRALRAGLRSLGVAPGDRVAILSENRLEWALTDLAALSLGAVDVPIYPTLLPDTIEFILRDCQPAVMFVSSREQADKVRVFRDRLPFLRHVIAYDDLDLAGVARMTDLEKTGRDLLARDPAAAGDDAGPARAQDLCSIIYTSGTTGDPKGVMLTHGNFVSNVLASASLIDIGPRDRVLSFLPLSHVLERMAGFYIMMAVGTGIAYAGSVESVSDDMRLVCPTVMISVPRLYEKIYARVTAAAAAGGPVKRLIFDWARGVGQDWGRRVRAGEKVSPGLAFRRRVADRLVFSKLRARTGGRLRFFVSGGAPLAPHINEFFYAAGMIILEGYGLTETSPVISVNSFEHFRVGSVGKVIPGVEVKIAEDGEIVTRGPNVMLGYYNNPVATSEVLTGDGWLHTGDIGRFDEDGYLYITDRKKDLIVTAGGKNVAPQPLENAFKKNKFISQVVVLGDHRPYLTCLIVPNFEELEAWAALHKLARRTGPPCCASRPCWRSTSAGSTAPTASSPASGP